MAVPVATDCTPRVWPACIACYSDGHLAGRWVDCADAADATLTGLPENVLRAAAEAAIPGAILEALARKFIDREPLLVRAARKSGASTTKRCPGRVRWAC